ncbi:MAG: sodium:solute symporter family transporter [Thermoplasmatota archaeon]
MLELAVLYILLLVTIGIYASLKADRTPEDYFLANRGFGPLVLFFTLAATNFSAFTFLGFAGAAYTHGLGQYGVMALGTACMAIMFYVIGRKVWHLGKTNGYVTPGELVGGRYGSRTLQLLFTGVMSLFTIPYLAIQAVGAGYILEMLVPGFDMKIGAIAAVGVICFYVLSGGMRASGWTDVVQGVLMVVAMVAAVAFVGHSLGGLEQASLAARDVAPSLFARPGPNDYFTVKIWLSFFILWVFCDPMFPQMFTRFYTAKSQRSLRTAMVFYPLLISFFFLLPVLIGVWAHGTGIAVDTPDNVLLVMVETYAPPLVFSFVSVGALAALMSTADSQLLSLSTMLTADTVGKNVKISRMVTVALTVFTVIFVVFGYDPAAGIMGTLVDTTFSGLVVLAPAVLATLYWERATHVGCIASILGGEALVFLHYLVELPTGGFLPSITALVAATGILIVVSWLFPKIEVQATMATETR